MESAVPLAPRVDKKRRGFILKLEGMLYHGNADEVFFSAGGIRACTLGVNRGSAPGVARARLRVDVENAPFTTI